MRSAWKVLPFSDAVEDESGGNEKTPQSEAMPTGRYPVVDQGKDLLAGYVDDPARLCKATLPVIVFGDHTKCFKYIDFPFCMGADGTKILRPKVEADVKFLYHYFRQLRLTDGGYDRHFKYLKRCEVPLPPLPEQRRIADILDRADALRVKRRAALARLDELTQAIFVKMFGDPVSNPRDWPRLNGDEVCERITVGVVVQPASYYVEMGVPALRSLNVRTNRIQMDDMVFFSNEDNNGKLAKSRIRSGDVLMVRSGQPGTAAVVPDHLDGANAIDILIATPDRRLIHPHYLAFFMNSDGGKRIVLGEQRGQVQKHLNVGSLREASFPVPPIQHQESFIGTLAKVANVRQKMETHQGQSDDLFAALQDRAFRGAL